MKWRRSGGRQANGLSHNELVLLVGQAVPPVRLWTWLMRTNDIS
jgi:hypothetical protein